MDLCEFEANLVYKNSKAPEKHCLEKQTKTNTNKKVTLFPYMNRWQKLGMKSTHLICSGFKLICPVTFKIYSRSINNF